MKFELETTYAKARAAFDYAGFLEEPYTVSRQDRLLWLRNAIAWMYNLECELRDARMFNQARQTRDVVAPLLDEMARLIEEEKAA